MNHVDLFSGIGGFARAATQTWQDYQNLAHSEVEKFPCKVYHKHFPESECLGDITKIDWTRFRGQVDLLTGGFPCQPHSVAGRRRGSKDERDLWGECVRALSGIRPRYCIFENVPGIITSEHGKTWERIKMDLDQTGYEGLPVLLSAEAVGAPHRRWRVWIVARNTEHDGLFTSSSRSNREIWGAQRKNTPSESPGASTNAGNPTGDSSREVGQIQEWKDTIARGSDCDASDTQIVDDNRFRWGRFPEKGRQVISGRSFDGRDWIEVATALCRVDDGLPRQLDRVPRLKSLGNAIVPQCAQVIMEAIKDLEGGR